VIFSALLYIPDDIRLPGYLESFELPAIIGYLSFILCCFWFGAIGREVNGALVFLTKKILLEKKDKRETPGFVRGIAQHNTRTLHVKVPGSEETATFYEAKPNQRIFFMQICLPVVFLVVISRCCDQFNIQYLVWKENVVYCMGHEGFGPGCFLLNLNLLNASEHVFGDKTFGLQELYCPRDINEWTYQLDSCNANPKGIGQYNEIPSWFCSDAQYLNPHKARCEEDESCSGDPDITKAGDADLCNETQTGLVCNCVTFFDGWLHVGNYSCDGLVPMSGHIKNRTFQSIIGLKECLLLKEHHGAQGIFPNGLAPSLRNDCKAVGTLTIPMKSSMPSHPGIPPPDEFHVQEFYYAYEDLYYCSEHGLYWAYSSNFEIESNLQKFEAECNSRRKVGEGSLLSNALWGCWGESMFKYSEEECEELDWEKHDCAVVHGYKVPKCADMFSCENWVTAVGKMYPDPVALEAAIMDSKGASRVGFTFTFRRALLSIVAGSLFGSATALSIGLSQSEDWASEEWENFIFYQLYFMIFIRLLVAAALFKGANRDRSKWNPDQIPRLIVRICSPYSTVDIITALAIAGVVIFRAVANGENVTNDGGPIVLLGVILALSGMSRSAVITGKNTEACFALLAMCLSPLSPTAGSAITLLASAWLEGSLSGTQIAGQFVPWYRVSLVVLNVVVALEYPVATMAVTLTMGQSLMSTAAPVWLALLHDEGLSATCREELEEEYRISWILFYLHGGSRTSIGHRLTDNERIINSGGAVQTESNGIVLLTKAGGSSAGLPWRVVTNSRERRNYATALDVTYNQEMREYAMNTGNPKPRKERPGGPRYGYLQSQLSTTRELNRGIVPKYLFRKIVVSPVQEADTITPKDADGFSQEGGE
jgi:hypothetical protein